MVSNTAIIHPNVILGSNCVVEDFVIIGAPPRGHGAGDLETVIGDNSIIRSHTVIYAGNVIGRNFQTGNKANIRELNEIGDNVSIGTLSVIEHHIRIGNNVRIHSQVFIPEYCVLENGCWIGPNVVMTNAKYPNSLDSKSELKGVYVKNNAIIGANSTLLPGVIIGSWSVVGAGSVVTGNVNKNSVVFGNPAHFLKTTDQLPYYVKTK